MKTQHMALVKDTVLKELRSKTLITLFIITTLTIFLVHSGMKMINVDVAGNDNNIAALGVNVLSITFQILNALIFLIAMIFGVSTIRSDFENNIIYQYLSFPIGRSEYFFIRVLGTWVLVFGYYIYAYVLSTILYSLSFNKVVLTTGHLGSLFIMTFYILVVIFLAILFSMMMNKLAAFISLIALTFCSSIAYNTFATTPMNEWFQNMGLFKGLGFIFYMGFPRLKFLSEVSSDLITGNLQRWTPQVVAYEVIHFVVLSAVVIFIANTLVRKKDF
jgi:ABC-type transport system involved in multi-copper enzyme maturation permease subunit